MSERKDQSNDINICTVEDPIEYTVDGINQTGSSDWASSFFATTTNGAGPDRVTTSTEVFDSTGTSHVLTFEFVRQEDEFRSLHDDPEFIELTGGAG